MKHILSLLCLGFCVGNPDRYASVGLNVDYAYTEGQAISPVLGYRMNRAQTYSAHYAGQVVADLRLPVSNQETFYLRFGRTVYHTEPGLVGESGWTMGAGTRWYFKP